MFSAGIMTRSMIVLGGCDGARGLNTTANLASLAFRKFMLKEKSKRKWHTHEGLLRGNSVAPETLRKGGGGDGGKTKMPKTTPRLTALNKIYLDKISEILSTGEMANTLYGRALELSEVRIHSNLSGITVYWVATGDPCRDQEMQEILRIHAREVRHQLTSLRLLGHSPPIVFLQDHRQQKLKKVEQLLATADYGVDFVPSEPSHHLRSHAITTSTAPLHPNLKTAIEDFDKQAISEETQEEQQQMNVFEEGLSCVKEIIDETYATPSRTASIDTSFTTDDVIPFTLPGDLPAMRGDVLGLNTTKIYKTVQQSIKRRKADHRRHKEENAQNETKRDSDNITSPFQLHNSPPTANRKRSIQEWASKYRSIQNKEARSKNKEMAMLSVPSAWQEFEEQEKEEVEVHWVEEEEEEFH